MGKQDEEIGSLSIKLRKRFHEEESIENEVRVTKYRDIMRVLRKPYVIAG